MIFNIESEKLSLTLINHSETVTALASNKKGKILISGSKFGEIIIHELFLD